MDRELQQLHDQEITERRNSRLYLTGFVAVSLIVVVGVLFALRWVALTVGGG